MRNNREEVTLGEDIRSGKVQMFLHRSLSAASINRQGVCGMYKFNFFARCRHPVRDILHYRLRLDNTYMKSCLLVADLNLDYR